MISFPNLQQQSALVPGGPALRGLGMAETSALQRLSQAQLQHLMINDARVSRLAQAIGLNPQDPGYNDYAYAAGFLTNTLGRFTGGNVVDLYYGATNAMGATGVSLTGLSGQNLGRMRGAGGITAALGMQASFAVTDQFFNDGAMRANARGFDRSDLGAIMNTIGFQTGFGDLQAELERGANGAVGAKLDPSSVNRIKNRMQEAVDLLASVKEITGAQPVHELMRFVEELSGTSFSRAMTTGHVKQLIQNISNVSRAYGLNSEAVSAGITSISQGFQAMAGWSSAQSMAFATHAMLGPTVIASQRNRDLEGRIGLLGHDEATAAAQTIVDAQAGYDKYGKPLAAALYLKNTVGLKGGAGMTSAIDRVEAAMRSGNAREIQEANMALDARLMASYGRTAEDIVDQAGDKLFDRLGVADRMRLASATTDAFTQADGLRQFNNILDRTRFGYGEMGADSGRRFADLAFRHLSTSTVARLADAQSPEERAKILSGLGLDSSVRSQLIGLSGDMSQTLFKQTALALNNTQFANRVSTEDRFAHVAAQAAAFRGSIGGEANAVALASGDIFTIFARQVAEGMLGGTLNPSEGAANAVELSALDASNKMSFLLNRDGSLKGVKAGDEEKAYELVQQLGLAKGRAGAEAFLNAGDEQIRRRNWDAMTVAMRDAGIVAYNASGADGDARDRGETELVVGRKNLAKQIEEDEALMSRLSRQGETSDPRYKAAEARMASLRDNNQLDTAGLRERAKESGRTIRQQIEFDLLTKAQEEAHGRGGVAGGFTSEQVAEIRGLLGDDNKIDSKEFESIRQGGRVATSGFRAAVAVLADPNATEEKKAKAKEELEHYGKVAGDTVGRTIQGATAILSDPHASEEDKKKAKEDLEKVGQGSKLKAAAEFNNAVALLNDETATDKQRAAAISSLESLGKENSNQMLFAMEQAARQKAKRTTDKAEKDKYTQAADEYAKAREALNPRTLEDEENMIRLKGTLELVAGQNVTLNINGAMDR